MYKMPFIRWHTCLEFLAEVLYTFSNWISAARQSISNAVYHRCCLLLNLNKYITRQGCIEVEHSHSILQLENCFGFRLQIMV